MTVDPLVYHVARCPRCGHRYAAVEDPFYPGQWEVMHADTLGHSHTLVAWPLLCVRCVGVALVGGYAAARVGGCWLAVGADSGEAVLS